MKTAVDKFTVFKTAVKKNVPHLTQKSIDFLSVRISTASESVIQVSNNVNNYLRSAQYEEDLDLIIHVLHWHAPNTKPHFNSTRARSSRVVSKSKYILEQFILFFGFTGATGLTILTAAGLFFVSIVAGFLVLRRISEVNESVDELVVL